MIIAQTLWTPEESMWSVGAPHYFIASNKLCPQDRQGPKDSFFPFTILEEGSKNCLLGADGGRQRE